MTALAIAPVIDCDPLIQSVHVSPASPVSDREMRVEIHGLELGTPGSVRLKICDKGGHPVLEARDGELSEEGYRLVWSGHGPLTLILEPAFLRRLPEGRHEFRLRLENDQGVSVWEPFVLSLEHPRVRFFRVEELQDHGLALVPGEGWDRRLDGSVSLCSVGRLNRAYYLFYIGACGDREDGGPRQRQLGFALSQDGLRFRKWLAPVLSQPTGFGAGVDGLYSAGFHLQGGRLEAYYSGLAALRADSTAVRADVWRGTARDLRLWEQRRLIAGDSNTLREVGRVLHPVAVLGRGRRRWIYSLMESPGRDPWTGSGNGRRLGLAEFDGDVLVDLSAVEGLGDEPVLGMSDPVLLSDGRYGFLLVRGSQDGPWSLEARTVHGDRPHELSEPEGLYFSGNGRFRHAAFQLDRNLLGRSRWLVYLEEVTDSGSRFRVFSADVFGK